ncbi:hypothetical protein [Streptomyces avidinii]|uniref:Uncharacterized protein n=2 Tax=Streptomyces avidinii TaxID=1895 RepID=A0ABS4KZC7_STRAV|nr:hypothetical protein [Streptomyces avidinii]MBP2034731.1 hypothetical protein [Streptomyces avidinii]GGY88470.1 hypothetical protein GCM10010343_12020 [Streptomyces avidinii]
MGDIEGAVAALDRSVQRILDRDPAMTGRPATALRESTRNIRTRMLGEGRAAVEQGERWSVEVGGVKVLLIPRGDESPA